MATVRNCHVMSDNFRIYILLEIRQHYIIKLYKYYFIVYSHSLLKTGVVRLMLHVTLDQHEPKYKISCEVNGNQLSTVGNMASPMHIIFIFSYQDSISKCT